MTLLNIEQNNQQQSLVFHPNGEDTHKHRHTNSARCCNVSIILFGFVVKIKDGLTVFRCDLLRTSTKRVTSCTNLPFAIKYITF